VCPTYITDVAHGMYLRNDIKIVYMHTRLLLNGVLKYFIEGILGIN
jgi:hypothetical protein